VYRSNEGREREERRTEREKKKEKGNLKMCTADNFDFNYTYTKKYERFNYLVIFFYLEALVLMETFVKIESQNAIFVKIKYL
jgi:hypothetical protein